MANPGPRLRTDYLDAALDGALRNLAPVEVRGRVVDAVGALVKATGVAARVGDLCELSNPGERWRLPAEVIGVAGQATLLMPFGDLDGVCAQTEVANLGCPQTVKVGEALLGRVLNGFGEPMDGCGPIESCVEYPVRACAPDPLARQPVRRVLPTGVRVIDGLLTCGEGQRVGIFAPAGAGKSTLLAMIAAGAAADVVVVALVGERGREVGEFIQSHSEPQRRSHTVYVVATSDRPAVERAKAANVATAIAEYFRDQHRSVLLLMDSVTRYARALREIGLAAGEPPTRRGFPPSVFSALPKLLERTGQSSRGAITAFYSVLVDDDQSGDPVAEEMRAILDGHLVLSNALAAAGQQPAVDVLASRSRVMPNLVRPEQLVRAAECGELLAKYRSIEILLHTGEYRPGADAKADQAVRCRQAILSFLKQLPGETSGWQQTLAALARAVNP
jgi:ATP synthase in type III secretion protein N